ncbi:DUF4157 domain-containing protein [Undibacterium sp. 14-3-2]|uniref:eCIS core domain-containing protein n=1 Tax=Undibacterium sp. 14-3-2 TaxID=2800129 RepID=UPI001F38A490|nr:DUF4157 domain-containing protein [Undibacterium sp. 14-3-2]
MMHLRSSIPAEQTADRKQTKATQLRNDNVPQMRDGRPKQMALQRLQEKANSSQAAAQLKAMQEKMATQRHAKSITLQGKFDTVQCVEEDELLQKKPVTTQRVEDEELLQGKFDAVQRQEHVSAKPNHTGLPNQLKSGIESLSVMSMDHVKVHYNSSQPAQLNALAYAQGSDIHVAPGQEQHLPHEAWHVVQQAQGRVKPTMQMKDGVPVNDDAGLETEADVMGAKALQAKAIQLKEIDAVGDYNKLGLHVTGDTFSVVDQVSKLDAKLHGGNEEPEVVENKAQALTAIAQVAGNTMKEVRDVVAKNGGYTVAAKDMNKPDIKTIDPFTHGHVQEYGDNNYVCLMYQHSAGLDGYVNGVEEGVVNSPGQYGRTFVEAMSYRKGEKAELGTEKANKMKSYKSQHDQSQPDKSLLTVVEEGGEHKSDAITKLAGEGARFLWVRNNIGTIKDSTKFEIDENETHRFSITFRNLWCTWKDWFKGAYNISEESQKATLLGKVRTNTLSLKGTSRIDSVAK